MCGLFGYAAIAPARDPGLQDHHQPVPDAWVDRDGLRRLGLAAAAACRRGPDAWGYALYHGGSVFTNQHAGAFVYDSLHASLSQFLAYRIDTWATSLIGSGRLATSGSPEDHTNNPPLRTDTVALVMNGVVRAHEQQILTARFGLALQSGNDTEILGRLIDHARWKMGHSFGQACQWATAQLTPPFAALLLDLVDGHVFATGHGQPLFALTVPGDGVYFTSRKPTRTDATRTGIDPSVGKVLTVTAKIDDLSNNMLMFQEARRDRALPIAR